MRDGFEYMLRTFGIRSRAVIHVGAHEGQERDVYRDYGAERAIFVEPIPAVFERLNKNISSFPGFEAVQAVCSDREGDLVKFNIASNEESSSLLALGQHTEFYPEIGYSDSLSLNTRTVDGLIEEFFPNDDFNVLVIDTQGAELKVLQGATELLGKLDAIYTEVNEIPLYQGSCTLSDLIDFLRPLGYGLKWLNINPTMFGDGLFVRNNRNISAAPVIAPPGTNVAFGKPTKQSSFAGFGDPSATAVDGRRTGLFGFHTNFEPNPWWEVDLQGSYPISEIVVFNRMDVCAHRARTLQILGQRESGDWTLVHDQAGRPFGGVDGHPLRVALDNAVFSQFRLQLAAEEFFHLDQVEIYSRVDDGAASAT